MEKANEEKYEARARLEKIDDEIAEKNAEIKRLSEELDDIYYIRRKTEQIHEEILEDWKGEDGFKRLYESSQERNGIISSLLIRTEEAIEKAETEKKKLISSKDGV